MLLFSLLISLLYPLVVKENNMSYWFMASIFALLSIKYILPYWVMYVPKYLIIAKEQKYKVDVIAGITNAFVYTIEAILLLKTSISVQLLLGIEILISFLSGGIYYKVMKKVYNGKIDTTVNPDNSPQRMSKDVLVHNLSGMVFNGTDNIAISVFSSLRNVTIYSNYNLVVSQISSIFQSIFDGITASIGIKIAHNDKDSYSVFSVMMSFSLFLATIISSIFFSMINQFIEIWVGCDLITSQINVFLFCLILYCGILIPCITSIRNACGLYKESKQFTIVQTILNLGITVFLTPFLGITGALIGTIAARLIVTIPANYSLIYKVIFPDKRKRWGCLFLGVILIIPLSVISRYIFELIPQLDGLSSIFVFCIKTISLLIITIILSFLIFCFVDPVFRTSCKKLIKLFYVK